MEILTRRLKIAPITINEFESMCMYAMDRENIKMMVFLPADSREEVLEKITAAVNEMKKEHPEYLEYAVFRDGEHIGGLSVYFFDNLEGCELGWLFRNDCRGQGYAAEAAAGLIDYFYREKGINRFIAQCDTENHASRRVMEKLGMKHVNTVGGRKNRGSDEERTEYLYELILK